MKKLILLLLLAISACKSSKDYLERTDTSKALQDAIKKINKNNSDEKATAAIPVLYKNLSDNHLKQLQALSPTQDHSHFDKAINHYNSLQQAHDAIIQSPAAFKLVNPVSYNTQLLETKTAAAEHYYKEGEAFLQVSGRSNAQKAYNSFKRTERYMPAYKDSRDKMDQAFEQGIVNVQVNRLQDNSFFRSGWGNYGMNYSNEYFQQNLVRELNNHNDRYPANFFTDWDAQRYGYVADWAIDITLRNLDIPQPITNTSSRNSSAQVQSGTDSSGRPIYQTVYATVYVNRMSFTAYADLETNIREFRTRKNINFRNFHDDYRWEQENASYTGDSRALSTQDWQLINNAQFSAPRKEEVLNELYRRIYPQVLAFIKRSVEW